MRAGKGRILGRLRDFYFDDATWQVRHLLVSIEPRQFGQREVLADPGKVVGIEDGVLELRINEGEELPPASLVLPVCKQYAALAHRSPGGRSTGGTRADAHLRSARAVMHYSVEAPGEAGGKLADFLLDEEEWAIRYLGVEQVIDQKTLRFYVLPQSIERFTGATEKVLLKELQPVALAGGENRVETLTAA